MWCTYDPDQANEILDSIGLDQKDGEGYRLRTDNGERLRIELTATVPAFVLYDQHAEMIRRVLINLLENAIKYSRTEGKISVTLERVENDMRVGVQDNGPGIPKEDQTRVFEKFARVQRKGRPKGLGLGLAFCRLAVEAHDGRIWVESEPGQGSTFYFTLPI